jgi:RNA polymerase sigma-70 factor (ECF subfamily)
MRARDAAEMTDVDLVALVRAGDKEAFRPLMQRHQDRIFRVACGMLRRPEDAMDAVQEVFIRVYERLADFKGESQFGTWLCRVTVNHCIDRQRRQGTFDARFVMDGEIEGQADEGPEGLLANAQEGHAVERALADLSPEHRQAIVLREVEGLSYEEIAAVMDCPKGTVMSRLHHARKKLQVALLPYLNEAGEQALADRAGEGVRRRA